MAASPTRSLQVKVSAVPEMMTPEQVAEYLQLTKDTIYRLIRRPPPCRGGESAGPTASPELTSTSSLLAQSTRSGVPRGALSQVRAITERNPAADGDVLLDELERLDEERAREARSRLSRRPLSRAVLDVNVLVSALLTPRGTPRQVVDAWQAGRLHAITSEPIVTLVAEQLHSPRIGRAYGVTEEDDRWVLALLRTQAEMVLVPLAAQVAVTGGSGGRPRARRGRRRRGSLRCDGRSRPPGDWWTPGRSGTEPAGVPGESRSGATTADRVTSLGLTLSTVLLLREHAAIIPTLTRSPEASVGPSSGGRSPTAPGIARRPLGTQRAREVTGMACRPRSSPRLRHRQPRPGPLAQCAEARPGAGSGSAAPTRAPRATRRHE